MRKPGRNVQQWDFLAEAWPSEDGIDGSGRALLYTIPFSAWVLQQNTEAGVSLVYRNDDGVDAVTLSPIPYPDQWKRGQVSCPGFCPHFVANRPECRYQQGAARHSISPSQVGAAGEI
jgi:hypothetical protein